MARVTAHIADAVLTAPPVETGQVVMVSVGTACWFAWLAQGRAFAFQGVAGHFTARREARPGVLHTVYLGRDADLTLASLERAAARLVGPRPPMWNAEYRAWDDDKRQLAGDSRQAILRNGHRASRNTPDSAFRLPAAAPALGPAAPLPPARAADRRQRAPAHAGGRPCRIRQDDATGRVGGAMAWPYCLDRIGRPRQRPGAALGQD